jgi:hypothetical protein
VWEAGRLVQIEAEMIRYKIAVVGISEACWNSFGEMKTANGNISICCVREDKHNDHKEGVAVLLNKEAKKSLLEWQPVSERIISTRLKTKVRGDLNAKVGKEDIYRPTIGKCSGHAKYNDNGIRLINFASSRSMVIDSTMFDHKDVHKMIWKFPDESTFNQIDYFIIDARHLSNLMDVRTYRGTNVDFDYYLVISNIRSQIFNARETCGSHVRKFNNERLKDPEVEARYVERIYESLTESIDSESVNGVWKALKEIMMSADITLGKIARVEHNYWFDTEGEHVTMINKHSQQ